jgi:hypothetical protein
MVWLSAQNNSWHAETQVETSGGMFATTWGGAGDLAGWGILAGAPMVAGGVLGAQRDARDVAEMQVSRGW